MIVLLCAVVAGGAITFALLWPVGPLLALMGAPFGASLVAGLTALYLYRQSTHPTQTPNASGRDALGNVTEARTDLTS
ncbi:hypothetical protein [Microvirga terricola]|uniref:Uncharacterized protein n=1 Tax=Microvirga terricola TaxID=2719797 RepID=A0ABX0V8K9_9HYPH|nr:hypothetical protein [Microvirga terricola]NIX76187.1 hypothetical protein [Microvirga terricola]